MVLLDYPSQKRGMVGPPEPMLLDTCVIQNIEWVWDRIDEEDGGQWTEERIQMLERRFGHELAEELLALGYLVDRLQWDGFPWIVSANTRQEFERHLGAKQTGLLRGWERLSEAQHDWSIDSFRADYL